MIPWKTSSDVSDSKVETLTILHQSNLPKLSKSFFLIIFYPLRLEIASRSWFHPKRKMKPVRMLKRAMQQHLFSTSHWVRGVEENFMSTNALTYVAGYLLKKCLQNHQCKVCSEFVIHNELDQPTQLFCHFKSYEGPFGSLLFLQTNLYSTSTTLNKHL